VHCKLPSVNVGEKQPAANVALKAKQISKIGIGEYFLILEPELDRRANSARRGGGNDRQSPFCNSRFVIAEQIKDHAGDQRGATNAEEHAF
jgi:hypothetical protein